MSGRFNRTGLFHVALVGCVVVTGGLTGGERVNAQGSFTTLVLEGDAAPGTSETFSQLLSSSLADAPLIDSLGNVLFEAFLTGSVADNNAIYLTLGTGETLVVREGGSAPLMGGSTDGTYSTFDELVGHDDSAQFLFTSTLAGTGGGPGVDDFLLQEDTAASARTSGTAGGDGALTSISVPFTSGSTEVYYVGGITGAGDGATTGLFQSRDSTFTSIARQGQAAPGSGLGTYVTFDNPTQADTFGNFAFFYSELTGTTLGTINDSGIFRGSTGSVVEIVRENDAAPDGLGGTDGTLGTFNPRISGNTAFQVAFIANRDGNSGGNSVDTGVYRATTSTVDLIIQEGTPLPDGNGLVGGFSTTTQFNVPVMNAAGQVAIHNTFIGSTGGVLDNAGILRGDGATLDIIVRKDQPMPDGNGRFDFLSGVPQINDGGLVLFLAFLQDTAGGFTDDAVILLGDGEELVIVAREGNEIDGMTITALIPDRSISTVQDRGNRHNVDALGRVAFSAILDTSTDGLFRFTPDLHYRRTASGDWDTTDNWTLGLNPNDEIYTLFIDPDASPIVTGPSGGVTVPALTIGGGNGAPTFRTDSPALLTVTGALTVAGGTLDHEQGTLTADSVQNSSNVDVEGTGTMVVTNDFVNDRNLNIFDSGDLQVGGMLENNDSVTITAANLSTGTGLVNRADLNFFGGTISGGVVTNEVGSSLDGEGTIDAALDNNGSMTLTGQLTITGAMTSTGTINIGANEQLRPDGGLTNSGIVNLDGGALAGSGPITNTASGTIRGGSGVSNPLTNSGVIIADSANVLTIANLSGGNTGSGELRIQDGSTLSISAGSLYANAGLIDLMGPGAILAGDDIDNTGNIVGQGRIAGSVNNFGTIRAVGGRLTLAGASNMNNSQGVIEATVGAEIFFSQGLGTQITSIVLSGGIFDNGGNALNNQGSITGHGTLRTGGLTNAAAVGFVGVGGGDMSIFGDVTNDNIVEVQANRTATFFGDVTGSGSFAGTGTIEFLAQFHPGSSPGEITFAGDVLFGALSNLNIELGGTTPGSEFDTLNIAGAATLGGTLDVSLIDLGGGIFTPTAGNTFEILSAAGLNGTFSTENFPALTGQLFWNINYDTTNDLVALEVVSPFTADFDGDGDVDNIDLAQWENSYGVDALADADADGDSDGADFLAWQQQFTGSLSAVAASTAVPEPATGIVLLIGMMALPFRRDAVVSYTPAFIGKS